MIRLQFIKDESIKAVIVTFQTSDNPAFVTIKWFPLGAPTRLK